MVQQSATMEKFEALRKLMEWGVTSDLLENRGRIWEGPSDAEYHTVADLLTPEERGLCIQRTYEIWQNAEKFGRAMRLDRWQNTKMSNQIGHVYTDGQINETLVRGVNNLVPPYSGLIHTLYSMYGVYGTLRALADRVLTRKRYFDERKQTEKLWVE